jgi:ABC-type glycerol-3-phosphate transport system substrate-binding protein
MNKLFLVQGDLLIIDNDAMEAMIFNKALLRDHGLENPYEIVKKGEWTFEKLIEMSKDIAKDLNGDGTMYIKDDLFGCIVQADTSNSFFVSGGEKV